MDRGRWDQVNTLLNAAMALPSGQRERYIQRECQDDPTLLSEVRSLLQAQDDARSFLEKPANQLAATLIQQEASQTDSLVGQQFEGYRIVSVLGRGGMGIVYKAHNITLDRSEALKVIAPTLLSDETFLRRFRLEARALAKTHHPNIVTIYTLRESGAAHYITMEFVEGHTIADLLTAQGALPWKEALPIIKQLLAAFAYAHQRGILHRDIKPRNVMLTPEGVVKVMDFGLAKFFQRNDATMTQGISGTPFYMSPEQIRGATNLDQRSDIFSLGMTIYEMLSGRLPFDRDTSLFNIQRAIIEDEFPTPHHLNAAIPARLSAMVMKTLAKKPEDRYQYAGEMLEALREFEKDTLTAVPRLPDETMRRVHPVVVSPGPKPIKEPAPAPAWRKPVLVAVMLLLSVGLVWGAVVVGSSLLGDTTDPLANAVGETVSDSSFFATNGAAGLETAEDPTEGLDDTPDDLPAPTNTDGVGSSTPQSATVTANRPGDGTQTTPQSGRRDSTTPPANTPVVTRPPNDGPSDAGSPAANATDGASSTTDDPAAATDDTGTPAGTEPPPAPPPAEPQVNPADVVQREAGSLRTRLKTAMENDSWSGVPGPIATFYQNKIKDLPSKFRVNAVDVVPDFSGLHDTGTEMLLPITVYLTIQQRGREGTQALPIPSTWTWRDVNGTMTLVNVDNR